VFHEYGGTLSQVKNIYEGVSSVDPSVQNDMYNFKAFQSPPNTTMAIPDGAVCYFCLGEEGDEEGKPLVRDCSCRGDSAGFAHSSCLVTYAEQKCKQADDGDIQSFAEPWRFCTNCKQMFEGQLSVDLASAFASFAEATYSHPGSISKWDKLKVLVARRVKIEVTQKIFMYNGIGDKDAINNQLNELLSIVDQTKKELKMSGWIHMPKYIEEYMNWFVGIMRRIHMFNWGECHCMSPLKKINSLQLHTSKRLFTLVLVGMTDKAKQMEGQIKMSEMQVKDAANEQKESTGVTNPLLQNMKTTVQNMKNVYE